MTDPATPQEIHDTWADRLLLVVLVVVATYSLSLVVAGRFVDDALFQPLGFGNPADSSSSGDEHVRLLRGVLGAVILGWVVLIFAIARGPLRRRDRWSWSAVSASLASWFIVDTAFSVAVSEWEHALFNVGFAVALTVPLWSRGSWVRSERVPTV